MEKASFYEEEGLGGVFSTDLDCFRPAIKQVSVHLVLPYGTM